MRGFLFLFLFLIYFPFFSRIDATTRVLRQDTPKAPKEAPQTPEQLCDSRPPEEYFRLSTDGDCRDVVRCDRAGIAGAIRLAAVRCPAGLAFDVERQTCDWKAKVPNCDKLDSEFLVFLLLLLLLLCMSLLTG